jgi:DNA replication protein DnaC
MLAIIGNELIERGYGVRFAKTTEILDTIKETFNNSQNNTRDIIKGLIDVEFLLIDDIGVEKVTDWVNEQFSYIIDKRMTAKKTTMFTSNVLPNELDLSDRIRSRINKVSIKIKFPEVSVRDMLADYEERKIVKELLKD